MEMSLTHVKPLKTRVNLKKYIKVYIYIYIYIYIYKCVCVCVCVCIYIYIYIYISYFSYTEDKSVDIIKRIRLMLFRKILGDLCKNHTKQTHRLVKCRVSCRRSDK